MFGGGGFTLEQRLFSCCPLLDCCRVCCDFLRLLDTSCCQVVGTLLCCPPFNGLLLGGDAFSLGVLRHLFLVDSTLRLVSAVLGGFPLGCDFVVGLSQLVSSLLLLGVGEGFLGQCVLAPLCLCLLNSTLFDHGIVASQSAYELLGLARDTGDETLAGVC